MELKKKYCDVMKCCDIYDEKFSLGLNNKTRSLCLKTNLFICLKINLKTRLRLFMRAIVAPMRVLFSKMTK